MNDRVLVAQMIAYIEKNLVRPITAEEVAAVSGYSLNRFRQKFFNVTGDTPSGYPRKRRPTEAAKEILEGARIVEVALDDYQKIDSLTRARENEERAAAMMRELRETALADAVTSEGGER